MIREIRKKTVILSGRMPFSQEVKDFAAYTEKKDWIYRNLKLEGSSLSEGQTEELMRGRLALGASVGEHIAAERLEKVLFKMRDFISRGVDIDLKLINTFHNIIAGTKFDTGEGYRRKSVIMTRYGHSFVLPAEIPGEMIKLEALIDEKSKLPETGEECFSAAAQIHNRILSIFPYEEENKPLARVTASYFLMTKGYPAVVCDMSEKEYDDASAAGLRYGDLEHLKAALMKAVLERTDLMIRLTAY